MSRKSNRVISLKWELLEIGHAVVAARIVLSECSADQRGEGDPIVEDAARAAAVVLSETLAALQENVHGMIVLSSTYTNIAVRRVCGVSP